MKTLHEAYDNWRIITEYTPKQLKSLKALQTAFTETTGGEIKGTLLESDEKGIPAYSKNILQTKLELAKNVRHEFSDSPLCDYANSLIMDVASYLNGRDEGLNPVYLNDPINLFCMQFVDWLRNRLMRMECKEGSLMEVKCWMEYLERIGRHNVFSYFERFDAIKTVNISIKNMTRILEHVGNEIKLELGRYTIEKRLNALVNTGRNYLSCSFSYLLHVLNTEADIPKNLSLLNLNINDWEMLPGFRSFLEETRLGNVLGMLATQPEIGTMMVPAGSQTKTISWIEDSKALSPVLKNAGLFLAGDGQDKALLSQSLCTDEQSGMVSFILDKTDQESRDKQIKAAKSFVKLCGLLVTLSQVLLHCREAAYLSGKTGDLLLCKVSHHQLAFLVDSLEQLMPGINAQAKSLMELTNQLDNDLIKRSICDTAWQRNHKLAQNSLAEMKALVEKPEHFSKHINKIRLSMRTIDEQIDETRKRLSLFIEEVNQTVCQNPWLATNSSVRTLGNIPQSALIKAKYSPEQDKNTFTVTFNRQTQTLTRVQIPLNQDCGFEALEEDRYQVIEQILSASGENSYLLTLIAPEALAFFKGKPLPESFHYMDSFQKYNQAMEVSLLEGYVTNPVFIVLYIKYYYLELQGGLILNPGKTGMLDAIAELKQYELSVWEQSGTLKRIHHHTPTLPQRSRHLLATIHEHQERYQGFYALLDQYQPLTQSTLLSCSSFFAMQTDTLFNHAKFLQEQSLHDEAVNVLNALITREPENGLFFLMRARSWHRLGRLAENRLALSDLEFALRYAYQNRKLRHDILELKEKIMLVLEKARKGTVKPDIEISQPLARNAHQAEHEQSLLQAAQNNDLETCLHLLQGKKVNVNIQNEQGFGVLHLASSPELIQLFLTHNANKEQTLNYSQPKDPRGFTPLHWHVQNERADIVKLLLEAGANVNAKSATGVTPVYIAAKRMKHIELTSLLMSYGANIRSRSEDGYFAMGSYTGHEGLLDAFRDISRDAEELVGEQGAKGMQAWHLVQAQQKQLDFMQKQYGELFEILDEFKQENTLLKKQMKDLRSLGDTCNTLRRENALLKIRLNKENDTTPENTSPGFFGQK